jgi:glycosyltransferase involved in cell wall biosynthesis
VQSAVRTVGACPVSPRLSVVVCSLNGAAGVDRCLRALAAQTICSSLELIVVDDGSTDATSDVARAHGTIVIRHVTNRGISAARNSGARVASASIVAFLDDDCEPEPKWAEQLIAAYDKHVVAVGGPLLVSGDAGFMLGYLARHNPLDPQELELANSDKMPYRLYLYLRRQWEPQQQRGRRDVFSFASANMSVRRQAFIEVGGFDERIRFGSEDEDFCRRLLRAFPATRLVFEPGARVLHHFESSLSDTLRRSRVYGRGSALMYRKWPSVRPTFFPGPVIVLAMLVSSVRLPILIAVALLAPHLLYPQGLRAAIIERRAQCLLDAYLYLAQEGCDDVGFLEGLWRFRHLVPELPAAPDQRVGPHWEPEAP